MQTLANALYMFQGVDAPEPRGYYAAMSLGLPFVCVALNAVRFWGAPGALDALVPALGVAWVAANVALVAGRSDRSSGVGTSIMIEVGDTSRNHGPLATPSLDAQQGNIQTFGNKREQYSHLPTWVLFTSHGRPQRRNTAAIAHLRRAKALMLRRGVKPLY